MSEVNTIILRAAGDMGAGKSVVLNIVSEALEAKGFKVIRSRNVPVLNIDEMSDISGQGYEVRLDEVIA